MSEVKGEMVSRRIAGMGYALTRGIGSVSEVKSGSSVRVKEK